jgi:hypothetical protein
MPNATTQQPVLFPDLFDRPLLASFDATHGSSDGGAILLKAADRRLGLTERVAGCLRDGRQSGKIDHEIIELLRQRVFAIACGYPDANDAARLSEDPVHKMLLDRDPLDGDALASQPTLSRFENVVDRKDLLRIGENLGEAVIERHRRRLRGKARRVTIDLDVTEDPTHGAQQLSFFNGYYDSWCYLPLLGFLRFNDEPEQYLFAAVLRPGNAPDKKGALGLLRRSILMTREAFPRTSTLVRLDGGFSGPETLEALDILPDVEYVAGIASNAVLRRKAARLMRKARRLSRRTGRTEHVYGECRYRAGTWTRARRVVIKAEVVVHPEREPKDNPRFVVTNLTGSPRRVYERSYCYRGEIENRIKELKLGMQIDRTSCTRFLANQFRVLMTAAAYVLMQELRLRAAGTACARSQVWMLREHLLKLGARVDRSARRIVLHLPASFPFIDAWRRVAIALGARAG